jgi:hypothetical protein
VLVAADIPREGTVRVEAVPGERDQPAHPPDIELLRGIHQGVLDAPRGLTADIVGQPGDERDVAERRPAGAEACRRLRQVVEHARHPHPLGRRGAAEPTPPTHPRDGADRSLGERSMTAVEAMEATDELGFEAIDLPANRHQVVTDGVVAEVVDGFRSQAADRVSEAVGVSRGVRQHAHHCTKQMFARESTTRPKSLLPEGFVRRMSAHV